MKAEAPLTCSSVESDNPCVNAIRFLPVDAVEKAICWTEAKRPEGNNYSVKVTGPK